MDPVSSGPLKPDFAFTLEFRMASDNVNGAINYNEIDRNGNEN